MIYTLGRFSAFFIREGVFMKAMRWKVLIGMVVFALLLSGCINIQQEYWLNGDGSAKISMDVGMSDALLSMGGASGGSSQSSPFDDLKKEFSTSNTHIKNVQVNEYKKDAMQHFAVTFEVANFEDFLKTQSAQNGEFDISLSHQTDGSIVFKQLTNLNKEGQTTGLDAASVSSMFKDMYWTVIVHAPQVISTNGSKMDDGTVQWKIPMADVFAGKAPSQLTATYKTTGGGGGGSVWIWLIVGLVVVLLAGAAGYYFLVLRKRPPQAPAGMTPGAYPGYPPPGSPYGASATPVGMPPAPVEAQTNYARQAVPPVYPPQAPPPQEMQMPPQVWTVEPPAEPQAPPYTPPPAPVASSLPPTKPLNPAAVPPAAPTPPPAPASQYPQYQFPQFPPAPTQGGYGDFPTPPAGSEKGKNGNEE
jgi:hypothetical protein